MYIVQVTEPKKKVSGGDLVVVKEKPYFVVEHPSVALLDAINCSNYLAIYDSLDQLNKILDSRADEVEIFSKEEYHFKLERR